MLFEIFAKGGEGRMETTSVSCIPFDQLDSMSKAGFKFKLDKKRASVTEIKKLAKLKPSASSNKTFVIRCLETNKIYGKQSEAAKDLGIDPAQVSDSIRTGRKRSGYTFVKEEV